MKFLLYGSKGWIGKKFLNYLEQDGHNVIIGTARVDNIKELEKEIVENRKRMAQYMKDSKKIIEFWKI